MGVRTVEQPAIITKIIALKNEQKNYLVESRKLKKR